LFDCQHASQAHGGTTFESPDHTQTIPFYMIDFVDDSMAQTIAFLLDHSLTWNIWLKRCTRMHSYGTIYCGPSVGHWNFPGNVLITLLHSHQMVLFYSTWWTGWRQYYFADRQQDKSTKDTIQIT
jgi:hypothetical protein